MPGSSLTGSGFPGGRREILSRICNKTFAAARGTEIVGLAVMNVLIFCGRKINHHTANRVARFVCG